MSAEAKIRTPTPSDDGESDSVDEDVERAAGQMLHKLGPMDSGVWDAVRASLTPEDPR